MNVARVVGTGSFLYLSFRALQSAQPVYCAAVYRERRYQML